MNPIIIEKALKGEILSKANLLEIVREAGEPGNTDNIEKIKAREKVEEIYRLAHRITRSFMGNRFDSCSIVNAKSGNCPEDCKWCAQSVHNQTTVEIYPLISVGTAVENARKNCDYGIQRFSLVTSGRKVSKKEIGEICEIVRAIRRQTNAVPCVSLGLADEEDMQKLYEAGVTRYHCNIESSPAYFKSLCTTHTTEDKLKTLQAARKAGMSLCSGGIIGMGETWEDRIDMALFLREHEILSIPINVLHPIKGTPLENNRPLTEDEYLLTVALFRIINPRAFLRFSGGRALLSKEIQEKALYIGINAAIMGDMLTTTGAGVQEDIRLFTRAGYDFHRKDNGVRNTDAGDGACHKTSGKPNIPSGPLPDELERHIWHPYSSTENPVPIFFVESAEGVRIKIRNPEAGSAPVPGMQADEGYRKICNLPRNNENENRDTSPAFLELIDGMSSWWAAIHGYNHPVLNRAIREQTDKMSHIMFGGFTHAPARELTRLLLEILPRPLTKIFYSDSGSVSVEVAMKMAIQYWASRNQPQKTKFATVRSGYHGDTWHAMSVCDPVTGMHSLFGPSLPIHFFAPAPGTTWGWHVQGKFAQTDRPMNLPGEYRQDHPDENMQKSLLDRDVEALEKIFREHGQEIAAFILEPVVQGAGGMRFYSPQYLVKARELCDRYRILLIFDEIATGFGRTGKMFAWEHAGIVPDIMTIGKGLTGGYMTLAATLCTDEVAGVICRAKPGVFMHGPTFMGNPLACAVACASVRLLIENDWQKKIKHIEKLLIEGLSPARKLPGVAQVRVLGAIGVIELDEPADLRVIQPILVRHGIWLRPFGKLVYTMPPYVINDTDLKTLCRETVEVLKELALRKQ